jgi:thymidylate kinase
MDNILLDVFKILDKEDIRCCILRDHKELAVPEKYKEIDMLVAPDHLLRFSSTLTAQGFSALPSWGHAPHYFFVAYNRTQGSWLKFDVVTDVCYGKPFCTLRIDLTERCLCRRRRLEPTYVLAPEDEFITLLLHCLIDKARFQSRRQARLTHLYMGITASQTTCRELAADVERYLTPAITWYALRRAFETQNWQALMHQRAAVMRQLFWRAPVKSTWRLLSGWLLRRLRPVLLAVRCRGLAVALLAPDGAGKTTLAQALSHDPHLRARYIYMGTNANASTIKLPTGRWLQKARNSGSRRPPQGGLRGLHFCRRLLEQWYRSGAGLYHTWRGRVVIFDRYTYDAVLAPPASTPGKRLRRWLLHYTCPAPDLVLVLDAPGVTFYTRKGEHTPEYLERQRQRYLSLQETLSNLIIIDATRSASEVCHDVTAVIWQHYGGPLGKEHHGACR